MPIHPELLAKLVCPVDHGRLTEAPDELVCTVCGRRYPEREGIPVMLVPEDAPTGR